MRTVNFENEKIGLVSMMRLQTSFLALPYFPCAQITMQKNQITFYHAI